MMVSLSDRQLAVVMHAAADLPFEKRGTYLERVGALLQQRAGHFSDDDVINAAEISLRSLSAAQSAA
jgi:hypothetical protein